MIQLIEWINDNWLAIAIPVLIFVVFWVAGLWLRRIAYDAFNQWLLKTNWEGRQLVIEKTRTPFLHWFLLLGAYIAIQVSALPSEATTIAGKIIASLFVFSLIWVAISLSEKMVNLYLPKLRSYLAKVKAPQPATILAVNIVRAIIVIVGVSILLGIWGAPNTWGILVLAGGLIIAGLALRDAIEYRSRFMKIRKLFLSLLVIAGLGLVTWTGYLLFTHESDPISGTVTLLLEIGFLIWIISVLRSRKYKRIKPSFKLVFFSVVGITLVCAFAGIEPLATYKDTSLNVITTQAGKVAEFLKETGPAREDVTSAVAKAEPAVVRIETNDAIGSGMVIDTSGYILTCNHVVEDVESATIMFMSGEQYQGGVIGRDELTDLAILKIIGGEIHVPIVTLGNSDKLEVGGDVVSIGYALGWEGKTTVSKGVISAFRSDEGVDYIQTDAAINPGNSGGPLINLEGQVIGIVSAKVVHEAVEGMSFAIAINEAKPFINAEMEKAHQEEKAQSEEQALIELEKETFRLINVEREERGIPPVVWNEALHNGAREHSENMQETGYLYHDTSGFYAECCYGASYASSFYATPRAAVEGWMSSTAGHREILLDPQYGQGAVGIARDEGFWATYRCY
jgi:serine protease Do